MQNLLTRLFSLLASSLIIQSAISQMHINNAGVTITEGTVMAASTVSGSGDMDWRGDLYLQGDLSLSNQVNSIGSLYLVGNEQSLAFGTNSTMANVFVHGNGNKILASDLTIGSQLSFGGNTKLSIGQAKLLLSENADINGAGTNAYVIGKLFRRGDGTLLYPVGTTSAYLPATLSAVEGINQEIAITAFDQDPQGAAGFGLLSRSSSRYWQLEVSSGAVSAGFIGLSFANENDLSTINEAVVAKSSAPGQSFQSWGGMNQSGDLASGSVTSTGIIESGIYTVGKFFDESLKTQDSLALVEIYNALAGTNWTDNSGWLSSDVSSWLGVTVENKRIRALDLPGNNLSGAFPDLSDGLEVLADLNLAGNQISGFNSRSTLTGLEQVDLSNNALSFGDLENFSSVTTSTLGPQADVLTATAVLQELGSNYTVDRTISGSQNIYRWFKDDSFFQEAGSTISVSVNSFEDEATYYAEVTNSLVPNVVLKTAPLALRVSSLERDSLALLSIFEAASGTNWTNGANWPENTDISTWQGVTVENNRVSELDLSNSNVTGEMPQDLSQIGNLSALRLSGNQISGLPDLTPLSSTLVEIDVSNNLLDFGDLEPNIGITPNMQYLGQGLVGEDSVEILAPRGSSYSFDLPIEGTNNVFEWTRLNAFGERVIINPSNSLQIDNLRFETMGIFTASITNAKVPGLVLQSKPVKIFATSSLSGTISGEEGKKLEIGTIQALRVPFSGEGVIGYDSLTASSIVNGDYSFDELVLGDLVLIARVDDSNLFIPTYFQGSDLWEEADLIEFRNNLTLPDYSMVLNPVELTSADGDGTVGLLVESNFSDENGSNKNRFSARRKLQKVGCSLRRSRRATGGRPENDDFELVVYKETDADGRVTFENLPPDTYRLNIEYPGIPMDPNSFIEFEVGEGGLENNTLELEATVDEDGIAVELVEELGFYRNYFKDLELYPNPVEDELTIQYSKLLSKNVKVQFLNLQGQLVKEETVEAGYQQRMLFDTRDIGDGIYLVRFIDPTRKDGQNIVTYRIIVRKR